MLLTVFETNLMGIWAVWAFTNTPGHRYRICRTYTSARKVIKICINVTWRITEISDFSEIKRVRKQCVPGVLFLHPSPPWTPGYENTAMVPGLCAKTTRPAACKLWNLSTWITLKRSLTSVKGWYTVVYRSRILSLPSILYSWSELMAWLCTHQQDVH